VENCDGHMKEHIGAVNIYQTNTSGSTNTIVKNYSSIKAGRCKKHKYVAFLDLTVPLLSPKAGTKVAASVAWAYWPSPISK
jgi:hypothetical protein